MNASGGGQVPSALEECRELVLDPLGRPGPGRRRSARIVSRATPRLTPNAAARSTKAVAELLECWRIVEVEVAVAGLAAQRASRNDIDRLTTSLDQMREAAARATNPGSEERFYAAHAAFHHALVLAANNHALAALVQRIMPPRVPLRHAAVRAAHPTRSPSRPASSSPPSTTAAKALCPNSNASSTPSPHTNPTRPDRP